MRRLILFFILCFSFNAFACPACNIHNYLFSTINASTTIYRGKIISVDKDKAKVEVMEILKNKKNDIQISEIRSEYLYHEKGKIGSEFLFCNPMISGVKFEVLDKRMEWEVKFLIDTANVVSTPSDAIKLIEGISNESYRLGIEYVKTNFEVSYDLLYRRMVEFRKECQLTKEDFFNAYRLGNLMKAFQLKEDLRTAKLLAQEIDSIESFNPGKITLDSIAFNGITPIGEYLNQLLNSSKNSESYYEYVEKYISILNNESGSIGVYFAYALGLNELNGVDSIVITAKNSAPITIGLLSSAMWYRFYWQNEKITPILNKIEKINSDPEISTFIEKRFSK